MPVVTIHGFQYFGPFQKGKKDQRRALADFIKAIAQQVASIKELGITENEVTVIIADSINEVPDVICFIDGLFEKPERTGEVLEQLASAVGSYMYGYFLHRKLVEVFVRSFNPIQGFFTKGKGGVDGA